MGFDHRGKRRTHCKVCGIDDCDDYEGNHAQYENDKSVGLFCVNCRCAPAQHQLEMLQDNQNTSTPMVAAQLSKENSENGFKRQTTQIETNAVTTVSVLPLILEDSALTSPTTADTSENIRKRKGCSSVHSEHESPMKKADSPLSNVECNNSLGKSKLRKGPKRKDNERMKLLREMADPTFSDDIVEALNSEVNGVTDVWDDLIRETAAHYENFELGNSAEYNIVGNAIFTLFPAIASLNPPAKNSGAGTSRQSKKLERPAWAYFSKCLSDFNRQERRRKRTNGIVSAGHHKLQSDDMRNLFPVLSERRRRSYDGNNNFSTVQQLMGKLTEVYAATNRNYNELRKIVIQTYAHRSKCVVAGGVISTLLSKNYSALKDLKLFKTEARQMYSKEEISKMFSNCTSFMQSLKTLNVGKDEKACFDDYFLVLNPKENFITFHDTREEFDSVHCPGTNVSPRLKVLSSKEHTVVTMYMGDFDFDPVESIPEGLLNLILATHLFQKTPSTKLGFAFLILESFAIGSEMPGIDERQFQYYKAMINALPSKINDPDSACEDVFSSEDSTHELNDNEEYD